MVGGAEEGVVLDGPLAVVPTGGALPGEVLLTGPEVVGQHPSGIQVYVRMRRRTLKPRASSGWW